MYLLSKATSLKTFFTQMLAYYKILRTFASLLKGSTLTKEFWRGGRVVDCGRSLHNLQPSVFLYKQAYRLSSP